MSDFQAIVRRERHERRLGNIESLGLLAVIALILAAWAIYL